MLGDCSFKGVPFKDLRLKPNCIVAGIIRDKETFLPGGDDCIREGDRVVVVSAGLRVLDLSDIVR